MYSELLQEQSICRLPSSLTSLSSFSPHIRPNNASWGRKHLARRQVQVQALHIDRKQHFELAWRRQQMEEALLKAEVDGCCSVECVTELRSLRHLDQIVDSAASSIVVVAFYSRSCGTCKEMLKHYASMCRDANGQQAGVRFLKHNIRDDFDDLTDVARLYGVRAVPCFVFFVGGAQMRRVSMMDSRENPDAVRRLMGWQRGRLTDALREMLFRAAPSARR
ncbi:g9281 [Coccomyxa elongata]